MATAAYSEWVEMLARLNPASFVQFKPSEQTLARVQELVTKKNMGALTNEETTELDFFVYLENMFGLAKARAQQLLKAA